MPPPRNLLKIVLTILFLTCFNICLTPSSSKGQVSTPQPWYFRLRLLPNGAPIPLENASSLNMRSLVTQKQNGKFLEITVTLRSLIKKDRGVLLTLHLPVDNPSQWKWYYGLDKFIRMDTAHITPTVAGWYPLTALTSAAQGIAVAVPVTKPAISRFYRENNEVRLEFSLGISPDSGSPDSVKVKILLWNFDPPWHFRQALDDYYFLSSYFNRRVNKQIGLWTTAVPESLDITSPFMFHEHGNIFFSLDDSSARALDEQIASDKEYGWLTFPYVHLGQMSRVKLTGLPANEREIDRFLQTQPVAYSPQQLKQYGDLGLNEIDFLAALSASRVEYADGVPKARIRENYTNAYDPETGELIRTWTTIGKQVSFYINPDPNLYLNGVWGHGKRMLDWITSALTNNPDIGGVYLDSMRWFDATNYRREHFRFSTLPLACDAQGTVYLPNAWGYYQFLRQLAPLLRAKGKFLMVNGLPPRSPSFFISPFADIIGTEDGNALGPIIQHWSCLTGRKPRLRLAAHVGDFSQARLTQYVNSSLSLGILPSAWGSYFARPPWVNVDESFATGLGGKPSYQTHNRELWQKVFALIKPLGGAGWRPVTQGKSDVTGILVERFVRGRSHLFTVYRAADATAQQITLSVEKELTGGLAPKAWLLPDDRRLAVLEAPKFYNVTVLLPSGPDALSVVKVTPPLAAAE
jgi:hypothetical protein